VYEDVNGENNQSTSKKLLTIERFKKLPGSSSSKDLEIRQGYNEFKVKEGLKTIDQQLFFFQN